MAEAQRPGPDPMSIERPPCPKCGQRMSLLRLQYEVPGIDRRTFECGGCGHSETMLVKFG